MSQADNSEGTQHRNFESLINITIQEELSVVNVAAKLASVKKCFRAAKYFENVVNQGFLIGSITYWVIREFNHRIDIALLCGQRNMI